MSRESRKAIVEKLDIELKEWVDETKGSFCLIVQDNEGDGDEMSVASHMNKGDAANVIGVILEHFGDEVLQLVMRERRQQQAAAFEAAQASPQADVIADLRPALEKFSDEGGSYHVYLSGAGEDTATILGGVSGQESEDIIINLVNRFSPLVIMKAMERLAEQQQQKPAAPLDISRDVVLNDDIIH